MPISAFRFFSNSSVHNSPGQMLLTGQELLNSSYKRIRSCFYKSHRRLDLTQAKPCMPTKKVKAGLHRSTFVLRSKTMLIKIVKFRIESNVNNTVLRHHRSPAISSNTLVSLPELFAESYSSAVSRARPLIASTIRSSPIEVTKLSAS